MQITDVIGLKWLTPDKTVLGGMVMSPTYGAVPLCVHDRYDTETGQKIWDDALAGRYGPIFDYVALEPDPVPIPKTISRRQFFQQLANLGCITRDEAKAALQSGVIPAALLTLISKLPEEEQFDAEMLIIGAATFARQHPLCDKMRVLFDWSSDQADSFWRSAAKL